MVGKPSAIHYLIYLLPLHTRNSFSKLLQKKSQKVISKASIHPITWQLPISQISDILGLVCIINQTHALQYKG